MKRILCYGDSNTWGHNPDPAAGDLRYADEVRWTGVLQKLLKDKVTIIEEGLCGRTIMFDDPLSPDRNGSKFLNCMIQSQQPLDMIIFMLGTNDVRHIFTPSTKEIAIGMQNMVKMAQNPSIYWVGKVPEILVIAPVPVREEIAQSEFYGQYDEKSVRKSRELAKEYQSIFADMPGVQLLDAGKVAEVSVTDCIHLSRKGHENLARAVKEMVEKILF